MEFGPINWAGLLIVAAMLAPNVLYAIRFPGAGNRCESRLVNLLEQVGRYGSVALMFFPLGVWKFGFPSVAEMLAYVFGNGALLAAYWILWGFYFRKRTKGRAMALAVIPTFIFLLSGVALRHWLLVITAAVFGAAHCYITKHNQ